MRRRALALAGLLAGVTLTLCIARRGATPGDAAPAPPPTPDAEPEVVLTGKRATAALRYLEAQRRQGFVVPSRSATPPAVAPGAQGLFHHEEGFPRAWLAPDERIDWPYPPDR
jgi:hypothetical protein